LQPAAIGRVKRKDSTVTKITYSLDLARYNYVELECFLAEGIITVGEFENEVKARGLSWDTITPPDNDLGD